jgi:hypothetical protein
MCYSTVRSSTARGPFVRLYSRMIANESSSINSYTFSLILEGYRIPVDDSILNPLVFEFLTFVEIHRSIGSIHTDVFNALKYIEQVTIVVESLGNFFHKLGIEWTLLLQFYANVIFVDSSVRSSLFYSIPDRDFCLFSNFPFQKGIRPIIQTVGADFEACTNSLGWLTQQKEETESGVDNLYDLCRNRSRLLNATFFRDLVKLCRVATATNNQSRRGDSRLYIVDVAYFTYEDSTKILEREIQSLL